MSAERAAGIGSVLRTRLPVILVAAVTLATTGCQRVGVPRTGGAGPTGSSEASNAFPAGLYRGELQVEGARTPATLELEGTSGRTPRALLVASPDITAKGEGSWQDGHLRLELSYDDPCPGEVILRGPWDPSAGSYAGTLRARDCTGTVEGTFLLRFSGETGFAPPR